MRLVHELHRRQAPDRARTRSLRRRAPAGWLHQLTAQMLERTPPQAPSRHKRGRCVTSRAECAVNCQATLGQTLCLVASALVLLDLLEHWWVPLIQLQLRRSALAHNSRRAPSSCYLVGMGCAGAAAAARAWHVEPCMMGIGALARCFLVFNNLTCGFPERVLMRSACR